MVLDSRCCIKADYKIFSIVFEIVSDRQFYRCWGRGKHMYGRGLDDMNLSGDVHAALVPEPPCLSRDAGIEEDLALLG